MATLSLRPVTPAQPAPSVHHPVRERYPARRSRIARLKLHQAVRLARIALRDGHWQAAKGLLEEASWWHGHALKLEQRGFRGDRGAS